MTPGLLFAVACGVALGAVALVLLGVGYLVGRESMRRQVLREMEPLSYSVAKLESIVQEAR